MGAEMCVLGYGSGGMVQRMWFRECGSGVGCFMECGSR
nr:hypothetical protein [Tanacetum cinerariifolium]